MCEHFTGADFKALLYSAQLAAIHRNANNSQLYKAMFKNTEMESTKKYDRCAETDVVTEEDRDSVIYVSSLTEGSIQLSTEELTKLHSEVGFCYLYSMLQKCMTKEGPKVDLIRPLVKTTWLTLKCFKNPWVWNLPFSYFKLQLTGFQAVFPSNSWSKTVCTKFMLLVSFFPKDITLSFPRKFGKLKNDDEKSF